MKVRKWNEEQRKYEENTFEIKLDSLLSEDWEHLVECPECHKMVKWGSMINAGNNFTENGLWLIPVCPNCAKKIWEKK